MTTRERNGRILLAGAVGLLFLAVVASMIAGQPLWPAFAVVVVLGAAGGVLMAQGLRSG